MKIGTEEIKELIEMVKAAKQFKPLAHEVVKAAKDFGPELDEILSPILSWSVEKRIDAVKQFVGAGFTKEEAIYMTMDKWWGMREFITSGNKAAKK